MAGHWKGAGNGKRLILDAFAWFLKWWKKRKLVWFTYAATMTIFYRKSFPLLSTESKSVKSMFTREKRKNILFFMVTALIVSPQSGSGSPALVPLATTTWCDSIVSTTSTVNSEGKGHSPWVPGLRPKWRVQLIMFTGMRIASQIWLGNITVMEWFADIFMWRQTEWLMESTT